MYPKAFFLQRFKDDDKETLLARYAGGDLSDEAAAAILELLAARGVDESTLKPMVANARKASLRATKGAYECDYCRNSARFSAIHDDGQRFCSKACLRNARLMEIAVDIPDESIMARALSVKNGICPVCRQCTSPVEMRHYFRVWSALVVTQWRQRAKLCCHSCGKKENRESVVLCLIFGWWGFPWGLIMTPAQIVANWIESSKRRDEPEPSDELLRSARLQLAFERHKQAQFISAAE